MTIDEQLKLIKRGAAEVISEEELRLRLEDSAKTKKPLVVKAGFDPTAPDIHLGHTVLLRKLKHFQDCKHKVIFLIGDATALVGDPSGQSATRKMMTWDEVEFNAKTYEKQVGKILDTKNPNLFERRHNSDWFSNKNFGFEKVIELTQKYTVARLLERDDFQKRLKENKPISFLELFYPLMQGYDSVQLASDIEVGGTDQKFNMLVGRDLQSAYERDGIPVAGHPKMPQVVITMPLLEGTDGVNKMSKSLGNTIGINESPKETFGKIMSVTDALMLRYYELLTDEDLEVVKKIHPKEAKMKLAEIIITTYHDKDAAARARKEFEKVFSSAIGGVPDDIPWRQIEIPGETLLLLDILDFGVELLYTHSTKNELRRLIQQGAVKVDGEKVAAVDFSLRAGREYLLQVAKRSFLRLRVVRRA